MVPFTHSLFALLVVSVASATPALAQKIYAGSATGSYTNDFCPHVQATLKKEYFEHECATSQGTGENVEKVLAEPASVGLGQFDIVAARDLDNPGKLSIVNPNIGLECLYAVTSDTNVNSLKGLSPRMPVALPPEKSGSVATFMFLQTLDERLAELRKVSYHKSALEAVQAVANGEAALAFFVQFPNTKNAVFQAINDANLKFVPVINRRILHHEVAGQSVYQPQQVVVTPAGLLGGLLGKEPTKIDTTCTPIVLFTGAPELLPEGNQRQDQEEVLKLLAQVPPPSEGDWKDVFKNAVQYSKDKFDALISKYSN